MKTLAVSMLIPTVLAVGCSPGPAAEETSVKAGAEDAVSVSVARVERRDIVDTFTLTGSIAPFEKVTVYSRTTGYLRSVLVDIGDRVTKAQLLAVVEAPEMKTALEEKRAAVLKAEAARERSKAEVERIRAELKFAQLSFERVLNVHQKEPEMIPDQEVDQSRAKLDVTRADLHSAETEVRLAGAEVAVAKASFSTTKTLIRYTRITSPLNGVVSARFVDPGSLIQEASSSRTQAAPVVTIDRLDRLRVIIDVPEPNVPHVKRGSAAEVRVPAYPGESFSAHISRVATVLDPSSRTMRAEIEIRNPDGRLRPGMTAEVSVELRHVTGAMTIPVAALHSEGGEPSAFVTRNGRAHRTRIRTGLQSPDWIEVAAGLKDTDEVVVSAAGVLHDGSPVKVLP